MGPYRIVGIAVVAVGIAVTLAVKVWRGTPAGDISPGSEGCCVVPGMQESSERPAPKIPTGSGRPCLVEFGSDECEQCQKMSAVMAELRKRLEGEVDIVMVDTDVYPSLAHKWRLRLIPTQILVMPDGAEVFRHEGYMGADELEDKVRQVLQDHSAEADH